MLEATEIRVGRILKLDGKLFRVITQEIRGTGKFGKTVHLKVKGLEDGNMQEKSIRAEDKVEDVDVQRVKMQFSYKEGDQFVFMNMENYEQFPISEKALGKQAIFLKENLEIDVFFCEGRAVSVDFPKMAELEVISTAPGVKGGGDFKEAKLENGLTLLVPQFVKEGEKVRINVDDLSYLDRVTTKSLKNEKAPPANS